MRLLPLDGVGVAVHHLLERRERLLALVEAAGPQRVERPVAREVLGEVDEDQHLAHSGVHTEQGRLVAAGLHGHQRVVPFGAAGGARVEPGGQGADRRSPQDRDDLQVAHPEPLGDPRAQPQDVQRGTAQVEEVGGGADIGRVGVEQLGVDLRERLLGRALGCRVAAQHAQRQLAHAPPLGVVRPLLQPPAHQRALDLAQAGLGEGLRGQRQDQRGPEAPVQDDGAADGHEDPVHSGTGGRVAAAGAGCRAVLGGEGDDQLLGVAAGRADGEGGDVGAGDAVERFEDGLDVVAEVVDAVDDDAVLAAPDQGQPALVEPAQVPAAEPAVGGERLLGGGRVVVVPRGDHRTAQLEFAHPALGQRAVLRVGDAHPQALHRGAETGELRAPVDVREPLAGVHAARAGLRHAEGGPQRVPGQPVAGEAVEERLAGGDDHGLAAADDVPQPGQVQPLAARAQPFTGRVDQTEQEVRGEGHGHAVPGHQPQELQWFLEDDRCLHVQLEAARGQRQQMTLQQRGHVVEGDPVEGGVPGGEPVVAVLGGHGGQQVGVAEDDRLGVAGRSGGQDEHGGVLGRRPVEVVRGGRLDGLQLLQGGHRQRCHGGQFGGQCLAGDHEGPAEQRVHVLQLGAPAFPVAAQRCHGARDEAAEHRRPEHRQELLGPAQNSGRNSWGRSRISTIRSPGRSPRARSAVSRRADSASRSGYDWSRRGASAGPRQ